MEANPLRIPEIRKWNWKKIISYLALILCPAATFYLFDAYTHNPFVSMDFKTQVLNIVFYELTGILLFGVFRTLRLALMLQSCFFMLFGLVNYFVQNFRSTPIMPWDIYSISTAAGVADNFSYTLEGETLLVVAGFFLLLLVEARMKLKATGRLWMRALIVALPLFLLFGYKNLIQDDRFILKFGLYDKLFTPTVMSERDGNVVAFMMELEYMNVEMPEGYSVEEAEALYRENETEDYRRALAQPEALRRPNIIVVMDEAFSDLSVLADFNASTDYMPFVHSLQEGAENTVTGYLNVSVLGGNTANTEFEFLTGHTMQFLPQGSVPYQQYLMKEHPSLASYLKDLGYSTIAVHPYNASGWERNRVYPLLGFDDFKSLKNFTTVEKIRNYVTDESSFQMVERLFQKKKPGEPIFIFNVTMQNHSGYTEEYANFKPDVTVEGSSSKALSQYLSLIKRTDQAFEGLVDYFSKVEEDTLIVFFGDHQPTTSVSNPVLRAEGIDPASWGEEENLLRYQVPYVIWGNFDIEEAKGQQTSPNYLALDILKNCGLPLPPYQNFLNGLRVEYPVVSGMQTVDSTGQAAGYGQMDQEMRTGLVPYQTLEYYLLFDFPQEEELSAEEQGAL